MNRFQGRILYPVFFCCFLMWCLVIGSLFFIHYIAGHLAFFGNLGSESVEMYVPWFLDIGRFNLILPWVLLVIVFILGLVVYWTIQFSNKLVGAYDRVIKEMDEVIAGRRKEPIHVRPGDELFEEILKRVNQLMERRA